MKLTAPMSYISHLDAIGWIMVTFCHRPRIETNNYRFSMPPEMGVYHREVAINSLIYICDTIN